MITIDELNERREKALKKFNKALKEFERENDEKKRARLDKILDESFSELRNVALEKRVLKQASENRCVCCGRIIPEGRQICPICGEGIEDDFDVYSVFHSGVRA